MLGPRLVGRHKRKINLIRTGGTERYFCLLSLFLNPLKGIWLATEIHSLLRFKIRNHPVNNRAVPVVTTQLGVAIGRHYLKHSVSNIEDRDIERSAAQIVNSNLFVAFLIKAVG